jgi:hypothetical protein
VAVAVAMSGTASRPAVTPGAPTARTVLLNAALAADRQPATAEVLARGLTYSLVPEGQGRRVSDRQHEPGGVLGANIIYPSLPAGTIASTTTVRTAGWTDKAPG